jgi:hypothetical protein
MGNGMILENFKQQKSFLTRKKEKSSFEFNSDNLEIVNTSISELGVEIYKVKRKL